MGELVQYYEKGMKNFTEGNLDKAFNYLKAATLEGMDRFEVNNAIALILMYRGEFEEAYKFFITNNRKYKDEISKKYLLSIDEINNYIEKHNLAVDLLNENKYDEALNQLISIRDANFRTVNDDMLVCIIYYAKKDYRNCRKALDEIHNINKEEIFYYKMKELIENKNYYKVKIIAASVAALAIIFSSISITKFNNNNKESYKVTQNNIIAKEVASDKHDNTDSNYKILANLTDNIMKGDLYSFAENDKKLVKSKLDEQGKSLYNNLKEQYKNKAEAYFYKNGFEFFKSGNYNKALDYFLIAHDNMKGEYLDEHVIYFLAKSEKMTGNLGIEYYKEYVTRYPKGCYIEECIYDLAIGEYKSSNKTEAKKYAYILSEKYPNSMYNNDRIKYIIEN